MKKFAEGQRWPYLKLQKSSQPFLKRNYDVPLLLMSGAIDLDTCAGADDFSILNFVFLRSGQFKGSKKSWPPQNVPQNGS
jgi:hypothetical protein